MPLEHTRTRHRKISIGELDLFFREAGAPDKPAVLL